MAEKLYLVVGTRYSSVDAPLNPNRGLSCGSVALLQHLRALQMFDDKRGMTACGDAWLDSQSSNDVWIQIDEIHNHFGLDLNG